MMMIMMHYLEHSSYEYAVMSFSSLGGTLARLQLAVDEFFDGYFAGAPNFWNFFGRKQLCIFTDYITQGEF